MTLFAGVKEDKKVTECKEIISIFEKFEDALQECHLINVKLKEKYIKI